MVIIDIILCKVRDKYLSITITKNDKIFKPDNTENSKLRFFFDCSFKIMVRKVKLWEKIYEAQLCKG